MSELLSIWNNTQLTAASPPPPFAIPNNPNARSIKINNQSRYWLIIFKTNSNIDVDRIEPFSYLTIPFERDLSLRVDTSGTATSSLQADKQFVDYSTIDGGVIVFSKGSTNFSGSSSVTINGSVNIANSSLNVAIQGTPTFNLGSGNAVTISGTPTINVQSLPDVNIANATLNVKLDQTAGNNVVNIAGTPTVSISGTPTMNIGTMPNVTFAAGSSVAITGTPTMNIGTMPSVTFAAGSSVSITGTPTMNIGTMPNVNIGNATLNVKLDQTAGNNVVNIAGTPSVQISGTPTMNIGTMPSVTFAAGSSVSITGTPTMNIGTMPNVTFAAGSSVSISGTPTMNIGTMPSVNIGNATLNVKLDQTAGNNVVNIAGTPSVSISGTPTMNIGTMPSVTFAAGSSVSITGTPTMNIGTMPNVTIANSTLNVALTGTNNTVNIGNTPAVTISGSPTMNIGTMPNVTIANSTLNVALTGTNNTVNIGNTPSVNVNNSISISSGTITVNSATISNQQLQVAQIYAVKQGFTVPSGTSSTNPYQFNFQFLNNGTLANVHHVDVYIYSAGGFTYKVVGSQAFASMADGRQFNASSQYSIIYEGANQYSLDGPAVICNLIQLQIELTSGSLSASDSITVYYAIDSNETSIGTTDGVIVKPYEDVFKDASGSITTANTSQQILSGNPNGRRYIFFQNLSTSEMYINFGSSPLPTVGGAGSIWVPSNGGSFVMENTFCVNDILNVVCATAGAKYTCKYN